MALHQTTSYICPHTPGRGIDLSTEAYCSESFVHLAPKLVDIVCSYHERNSPRVPSRSICNENPLPKPSKTATVGAINMKGTKRQVSPSGVYVSHSVIQLSGQLGKWGRAGSLNDKGGPEACLSGSYCN